MHGGPHHFCPHANLRWRTKRQLLTVRDGELRADIALLRRYQVWEWIQASKLLPKWCQGNHVSFGQEPLLLGVGARPGDEESAEVNQSHRSPRATAI